MKPSGSRVWLLHRTPNVSGKLVIGAVALVVGWAGVGCDGVVSSLPGEGDGARGQGDAPPPADAALIPGGGLRRLTASEYNQTLRDLLEDETAPAKGLLPEDALSPFDNDEATQVPSAALIDGAALLASDAASRLVADAPRLGRVLGCQPTGPGDENCMRTFVRTFGRRALRRPITDPEVTMYVHGVGGDGGALAHAMEAGDFSVGVDSIVRTMLQDPEFLYRVEIGVPVREVPGLFKLTDWEMASRLSYLLWGSSPDDALLDRAEAGGLRTSAQVSAAAQRLLTDPRAVDRIARFHAMWLGYEELVARGNPAGDAMWTETTALLERVILQEQRPWHDVFRFAETFIDSDLAERYDLPPPAGGEPAWVSYGTSGRAGLLSHASFLAIGHKFGDTSPVQRGLLIRTRLFCQEVPPPPPEVNVDERPATSVCKEERYAEHSVGACAGCHRLMDPIGFGLENYDGQGRYREFEYDNPDTPEDESQCEIPGVGALDGVGQFRGPAELGELALQSGGLDSCVATQLYRFAMGRSELDDVDRSLVTRITDQLTAGDFRFDELILEFVSSESFGYVRGEP